MIARGFKRTSSLPRAVRWLLAPAILLPVFFCS